MRTEAGSPEHRVARAQAAGLRGDVGEDRSRRTGGGGGVQSSNGWCPRLAAWRGMGDKGRDPGLVRNLRGVSSAQSWHLNTGWERWPRA